MTNVSWAIVTPQWIVDTCSQRNWVELVYREAKGWLGLNEYQVGDNSSWLRHFILVFCAYTFILCHQWTGGLRPRWAKKPLNTFTEALETFTTAISFYWLVQVEYGRVPFSPSQFGLHFINVRCINLIPNSGFLSNRGSCFPLGQESPWWYNSISNGMVLLPSS